MCSMNISEDISYFIPFDSEACIAAIKEFLILQNK